MYTMSIKPCCKEPFLFVCIITVLCFVSTAAFAEPPSNESTNFASIFAIPADDVSKALLNYLFGRMEGVLSGGTSFLLGKMFSIFNSTVLAIGGFVILYTLVVSILNTAQEGTPMGQKWSSMWIPIRAAIGIALLLPKESGYSIIQIIIMWVVLQGIGAADSVWGVVVKYVNEQGSTVGSTPPTDAEITKKVWDTRGAYSQAFQVVGCKNAINRAAAAETPLIVQNPVTISESKIPRNTNPNGPPDEVIMRTYSISFGGGPNSTISPNVCGTISWVARGGFDSQYASAVAAMLGNAETFSVAALRDSDNAVPITSNGNANINANQESISAAYQYLSSLQNLGVPPTKVISDEQQNQGWIVASSYYSLLAKNDTLRKAAQDVNVPKVSVGAGPNGVGNELGFNKGKADKYMDYVNQLRNRSISNLSGGGGLPNLIFEKPKDWTGGDPNLEWAKEAIGPLGNAIGDFIALMKNPKIWVGNWIVSPTTDPIVQVQGFGQKLLQTVEEVWFYGGLILFGATLVLGLGSSVSSVAFSILALLTWIVPLMMTVLLFVFIGGAMLAYFVPMLPFLIFTFGALGWLLSVIEAVVAGPLVALGVLHPEGHEVWGEAKSAIMLLLGIFLRPVLLIFGLITSISLSYAAIALTNLGFASVVDTLYFGDWLSSLVSGLALIIIYVSIVVAVMTFTTRLITQLPNHVLRWIGGGNEGYGEEQMVGEVQRGFQQGMEGVGGGFQAGAKSMGDAAKGQMEAGESKGASASSGDSGGDEKKDAAKTAAKAALL